MNIQHFLLKSERYQTWFKFYNSTEADFGFDVPNPIIWSQIEDGVKHFTPDVWIAWHQIFKLHPLLSDIAPMMNDPEIASIFKNNVHFQDYIHNLRHDEHASYNTISCLDAIPLTTLIYTFHYLIRTGTFSIERHQHLMDALDNLEAQNIEPADLDTIASLFAREYISLQNHPLHYRLAPYFVGSLTERNRNAVYHFIINNQQHAHEYITSRGWEVIALSRISTPHYQSLLSDAVIKYPELIQKPSIILNYPYLNPEYYIDFFLTQYKNNHAQRAVIVYEYHIHLEKIFKDSGIPIECIHLSLEHKEIAEWLSAFAQSQGWIKCTNKTKIKKWLLFCEEQLHLPKNYLLNQYNITEKIMPGEWIFNLKEHQNIQECDIIIDL